MGGRPSLAGFPLPFFPYADAYEHKPVPAVCVGTGLCDAVKFCKKFAKSQEFLVDRHLAGGIIGVAVLKKTCKIEVTVMLLEFGAKNYKSFWEPFLFSMVPAPKQKGIDYSILEEKICGKAYKGLSSAVIYGANASGKTNIIGAIDTLKTILLRGNIKNTEDIRNPNYAAATLELIPNCKREIPEPVEFLVSFLDGGIAFRYELALDLGTFLNQKYPRRILREALYVNGICAFERTDRLHTADILKLQKYLNTGIAEGVESVAQIAENSLNEQELFLTNGFKTIFSKRLAGAVTEWVDQRLIVIYRSDAMQIMRRYANPKEKTVYVEKTLTDAAKEFGINSNALGYRVSVDSGNAELCSIFRKGNKSAVIPAEMFESYGTVRFIHEFPLIVNAMLHGATLIMDEFDASIHPMLLMNIINIFHNDDINKNHAQLIFNTHNPVFLTANLFRRDEIKFVERNDNTEESIHYSLSDFKTYGKQGVRKGEDYMKNYFISRYGAIKDVDFSPILERILEEAGEDHG